MKSHGYGLSYVFMCLTFFKLGLTVNNYFDPSEINRVKELHAKWIDNGYKNVLNLVNCDHISRKLNESGLYDPETPRFWNIVYRDCNKHQMMAMCGSEVQNESNVVPHSHLCDGHIVEYANYHICVMDDANLKVQPCVVISIGSNNLWHFEEEVFAHQLCDIHTFDPREYEKHGGKVGGKILVPEKLSKRTTFHQMAIGRKSGWNGGTMIKSFPEILQLSNVTAENPLSIFKIDCEGCEHTLFASLEREKFIELLPAQVVMEGTFLLIYISNFHVLSHLLLIYICKLHWNLKCMSSPTFIHMFAVVF